MYKAPKSLPKQKYPWSPRIDTMGREDIIVREFSDSGVATFVLTENFNAPNISQHFYNVTRYQFDAYTPDFLRGRVPGLTVNLNTSAWAGHVYRDVHRKKREAFLGNYGKALTKKEWSFSVPTATTCYDKTVKNGTSYELVNLQQAKTFSRKFCTERFASFANATSDAVFYPTTDDGIGGRKSSLMFSNSVNGTNRTVTVSMGANPTGILTEQPLSRFFDGSTWDEQINSCETTFYSIIDNVCFRSANYNTSFFLTQSSAMLQFPLQNPAVEQPGSEEK